MMGCLEEPRWADVPGMEKLRDALVEDGLRTLQCFLHNDLTDRGGSVGNGPHLPHGRRCLENAGQRREIEGGLTTAINHLEVLVSRSIQTR